MQARSAKWTFRTIVILCKVVIWLWINISQVVFVYLVVTGRLRQHCIGCFPAKTCLSALGKHCTSNFNVQCSLRRISATLTRQYSYAMLSQYGGYNIALVIFAKKVVCLPWANFAQVISLWNVNPERSGQHCRLFSSAKLFVVCAMTGEWNDRSTAGRQRFLLTF